MYSVPVVSHNSIDLLGTVQSPAVR
jgi:hypothetical protein